MTQQPHNRERSLLRQRTLAVLGFLKPLLIPLFCAVAAFAGVMIGYVYMGGQQLSDLWHITAWKHIVDLVLAP